MSKQKDDTNWQRLATKTQQSHDVSRRQAWSNIEGALNWIIGKTDGNGKPVKRRSR